MKQISKSEFYVMEALWDENPLGAKEVNEILSTDKNWNIKTTKTLLSRLVEKGFLKTRKDGHRFLYSPVHTKEDYAARSMNHLSKRLFDGSPVPIVLHLARTNALSKSDRDEITKYLEELKGDD